ncbi:MAG: tRNA (adenosine(37)-N6)-threonylcarbamoyltransferase complex ATPase subunit type 1 TsaE [Firmicutes bacterium]|nr:tRNA (adenosine(37)-N6)-threonylcarbamoyltransferase complex ATPase subunit type 1 TsaE [Bacillota bacterium]
MKRIGKALSFLSSDPGETRELGRILGALLGPGDIVLLEGELGAGKTVFVKGLASALGVPESEVHSPSFALINEYRGGSLPFYHFDAYRLNSPEDLEALGCGEYFDGPGVTAIEWGGLAEPLVHGPYLSVTVARHGSGDSRRLIELVPNGERAEAVLKALEEAFERVSSRASRRVSERVSGRVSDRVSGGTSQMASAELPEKLPKVSPNEAPKGRAPHKEGASRSERAPAAGGGEIRPGEDGGSDGCPGAMEGEG